MIRTRTVYLVGKLQSWGHVREDNPEFRLHFVDIGNPCGFMLVYETYEEAEANADGAQITSLELLDPKR